MASRPNQIRTILDGLNKVATQVVQKVTLDIVANLVRAPAEGGTPVDTGWARSNWLINIGTPVLTPSGLPGQPVPGAQAAGVGSMLTYQLGPPVFITNNVPYIVRLNDGSSKQAPAGFVQRAIEAAVRGLSVAGLNVRVTRT